MKGVILGLALIPSVAMGQHTNILISDSDSPDEPSICINPANTLQLVAGANLNEVYHSGDGGLTWTVNNLVCPDYNVWGDPSICCDALGNFYFFHLSNPDVGIWIDRIVCQKSTDAGTSWGNGTFTGLNPPHQQDKQWPTVDRSNNHMYVTWTEFDEYGTSNSLDSSRIFFSSSPDAGDSWSDPVKLNQLSGDCIDSDGTAEGATPCVGPDGEIYVAWSLNSNIYFDRSLDGGDTWLNEDKVISDQPGGWDYAIPGLMRCNGLPVIACDTTGGAYDGTIYVNWTDDRNGATDHDVFVAKSTDGGNTWGEPIRVNDDETNNEQFFTWMTIDQATGYVWFVFYDRRNYTANSQFTDVYMAVSYDGCETFQNFKVSESPFDPSSDVFFGDYTNVTAYNNVVRPIWERMNNSQKSIWTALVDVNWLAIPESERIDLTSLEQNYPNPTADETWISFKVHHDSEVTLRLYDNLGRMVAEPIRQKHYAYGKYIEQLHLHDWNLAPGVYSYELIVGTEKFVRHMIVSF